VAIVAINPEYSRVEQSLEVLTEQVGRLTEGLYEFRADLRGIKGILQRQTEFNQQQAETAASQAETTASLVRIVEKLLNDRSQQS
jgi:hypothetical protein